MLAGAHDPAEIIASVKNGIYAVNFGGGQVDITNGKFVFSAAEAWKIENGKLAEKWSDKDALGFLQQIGVIPRLSRPDQE